ncbi:MAG: hypothetical protein KJO23_01800, partial [Bacteroidia bacterium]|nr:hypothetical protein [Bacteroidia bacterium]
YICLKASQLRGAFCFGSRESLRQAQVNFLLSSEGHSTDHKIRNKKTPEKSGVLYGAAEGSPFDRLRINFSSLQQVIVQTTKFEIKNPREIGSLIWCG